MVQNDHDVAVPYAFGVGPGVHGNPPLCSSATPPISSVHWLANDAAAASLAPARACGMAGRVRGGGGAWQWGLSDRLKGRKGGICGEWVGGGGGEQR